MALSGIEVDYSRPSTDDEVMLIAMDRNKRVIVFIAKRDLDGLFKLSERTRLTLRHYGLLVEANKTAFRHVITEKYERGPHGIYKGFGQEFPKVVVTLDDLQRSGEEMSAEVLKLDAKLRGD
jgi:hypothetical protein